MNLDFKMLIWDQKMGSKLRKFLGTSLDLDYFIEKKSQSLSKMEVAGKPMFKKAYMRKG